MKSKGFTLIELLAVIVILAIIALIATPIVLDIISDTKESARLRSAEFYLDAIEKQIALAPLNNIVIESGEYVITSDGEVCLDAAKEDKCVGKLLKLEVNGEKPEKGVVTISKGQITEINLYYDGKLVNKTVDNPFIIAEYEFGAEIEFDPGYGSKLTWNVINETSDTLTLLLKGNLPISPTNTSSLKVNWNTVDLYNAANTDGTVCPTNVCTDEGPLSIFDILSLDDYVNFLTNVNFIENFSYANESYGSYKSIEIKDGEITITDDNGNKNILPRKTKMRILTFEELYKMILMSNPNFSYEISDVRFDENFEVALDSQGLEYAKEKGLYNWHDVREYSFKKNFFLEKISKTEELIINSQLALYSENKIFGLSNIVIPNWIYSNLSTPYALLNSLGNYLFTVFENSPSVIFEELCDYSQNGWVCENTEVGIRPVIEVSKDKLK